MSEQKEAVVAASPETYCVTVREVMAIYRIGRCAVYEQAALFLKHGPGHGIPCLRLGHSLRFPITWIEEHIGRRASTDVPSWTSHDDTPGVILDEDREEPLHPPRRHR